MHPLLTIGTRLTQTLTVVCLCASAALAQAPREQPDMTLSPQTRTEVIETLLKRLEAGYVFPETAKKMDTALRKNLKDGAYNSVSSAKEFAKKLTDDLQAVSKDKHLRVRFNYDGFPERTNQQPSPKEIEEGQEFMRRMNYGFEKVERLEGNIGYIDLRGFFDPQNGGDTVMASMQFLANTDALIIDLRQNGGGDPAMVQLICSYLFDGEPVHLNDLYFRPSDSTQQYWTLPYVPGKRYLGKDVYLLTSQRTFSGAEEFSYNLKNLKRAKIYGETTGGGAHPGGMERLNAHFAAFVPNGRAINPITKTNWEGTGVKPDVEMPAPQALKAAHINALESIVKKSTDPRRAEALKEVIERQRKELEALKQKS